MRNLYEEIGELGENLKLYAETKLIRAELKAVEKTVESSSAMTTGLILGSIVFVIVLLFTALSVFLIGNWLDSIALGITSVLVSYILVFIILYKFRTKVLTEPIKNWFYGLFLPTNSNQQND